MILEATHELVDVKTNTLYTRMTSTAFGIGQGGYDGPRGQTKAAVKMPNRAPDAVHVFETTPETALLYRLCGDYNPLHADNAFGERAGFKGAIMQGLGTWNIAAHGIFQTLGSSDVDRFKSFGARFKSVVYPGDVLTTKMWRMGQENGFEKIGFETLAKRTDGEEVVALSNGYCTLKGAASKL